MSYKNKFFTISPHCSLKRLEEPYLYDIEKDELYELSEEAYPFLLKCFRGESVSVKKGDEEFIQYCLSENLITLSETLCKRKDIPHASPIPSLRYLEFQITDRYRMWKRGWMD